MANNIQVGLQVELNKFDNMKTKGLVELRILDDSKYHEKWVSFRSFPDRKGVTWGIPIKIHQNGDIEWRQITLRGSVIRYNLSSPMEAKEWHIVSNSPFVKGSPNESAIDARYKVYDIEQEANKFVDETDKMIDALNFIKAMDNNMLCAFGPLFGISPATNSPAVIRRSLLEKAKTNPASILARKDKDTETAILIVLKRGQEVALVKHFPERGYVYNEINLGFNDNQVVEFLRSNPLVLTDLDAQSKKKSTFYTMPSDATTEKSGSAKKDDF